MKLANDVIRALGYAALFENIQRATMAYPPTLCSSVHLNTLDRNLSVLQQAFKEEIEEETWIRRLGRRTREIIGGMIGVDVEKHAIFLFLHTYLTQQGLCTLPLCVENISAHTCPFESIPCKDWNEMYMFAGDAETYFKNLFRSFL